MRNFLAVGIFISLIMVVSQAGAQGTINNSSIGLTSPQAGKFTNLEAITQITLGADTVTDFDNIDGKNVKVSTNDTTPGFLNGKLVGGSGVTLTEGNDGANETLTISSPATLTTKGDVLIHNGTSETRLPVGASGQYLTSDTNDNLLWANPPEGDQLFNSNVLLNAYRTAENLDLTVSKMIDGTVDAFTDASGVDATASTNEELDSGNDYYKNTGAFETVPMVRFDGTNDWIEATASSLGLVNGKSYTLSFWLDLTNTTDGTVIKFVSTKLEHFQIQRFTDNKINVALQTTTPTLFTNVFTTNTITASDGLVHIGVAIDSGNSTQADRIRITINGVNQTLTNSTGPGNDTADIDDSEFAIGGNTNGGQLNAIDIGQYWFDDSYIDLSVSTNMEKFYDNGNPVDLGSDGSTPTGNQPLIFLNNTTSAWKDNLGSGGNFTENGTLADGTDIVATPDNLTLISNSQTAKTEPDGANILLLAEDVNADITLNTDLKASVSRDGGTTFTQVTLSDAGEFENGNLLTGTVDISAQPSGTNMEWKVETLNNKALNLHGVGLEWR